MFSTPPSIEAKDHRCRVVLKACHNTPFIHDDSLGWEGRPMQSCVSLSLYCRGATGDVCRDCDKERLIVQGCRGDFFECPAPKNTPKPKPPGGGFGRCDLFGAPDWIRTSDPSLRRAVLYPSELRAQNLSANHSRSGVCCPPWRRWITLFNRPRAAPWRGVPSGCGCP